MSKHEVKTWSGKLRFLAHWIDMKFPDDADPEMQRDLRALADALSGIPDPAAFVERAKRALEVAEAYCESKGMTDGIGTPSDEINLVNALYELRTALETP